ncbi:MAG: hypothetical protein ACTHJW_20990, partial [Streptosporangiaceae bacterium]
TNILTLDAWDPKSGTAEFKATAIRVDKLDAAAHNGEPSQPEMAEADPADAGAAPVKAGNPAVNAGNPAAKAGA